MLGVNKNILIKLIGIICMIIWLSYSIHSLLKGNHRITETRAEIAISQQVKTDSWEVVNGGLLADIRAMAFDKSGKRGVAISLDGYLISSENGGLTWDLAGKMPLEDGDIINCLTINDNGLFVGTAVDESLYGAIYHLDSNGKWQVQGGQYGGIFGVSSFNTINSSNTNSSFLMVGSNGLMIKGAKSQNNANSEHTLSNKTNKGNTQAASQKPSETENSSLDFHQLPLWAQINLYAIDKNSQRTIVAGDYGLVCNSSDDGIIWKNISPDSSFKLPFYAVSLNEQIALVGGSAANLWKLNQKTDSWQKITGLKNNLTVFATYADKDGICVAAGGNAIGESPFILYSSNNGESWQQELIPEKYGRIVSIAKSVNGLFAATIDGHILIRKNPS